MTPRRLWTPDSRGDFAAALSIASSASGSFLRQVDPGEAEGGKGVGIDREGPQESLFRAGVVVHRLAGRAQRIESLDEIGLHRETFLESIGRPGIVFGLEPDGPEKVQGLVVGGV